MKSKLVLFMNMYNIKRKNKVAKLLDVSPQAVSEWLNGRRNISKRYIEKIEEYIEAGSIENYHLKQAKKHLKYFHERLNFMDTKIKNEVMSGLMKTILDNE